MCGWIAFCLFEPTQPAQTPGQRAAVSAAALIALPGLWWGVGIIRRGLARNWLKVDAGTLTIDVPQSLRRPLTIEHADIAAVLVDDTGTSNGDERLRFLTGTGDAYLYSSLTGSPLPMLGGEGTLPNVAVVFTRPLAFDEPRHRPPSNGRVPLRPLRRNHVVPGVLLCCERPNTLGGGAAPQPAAVVDESELLVLRHPLTEGLVAWWIGLRSALVAIVLVALFLARVPERTAATTYVAVAAAGSICAGLLLDARARGREHRGWKRVIPTLFLVAGLVALFALVVSSNYG